MKNQIIIKDCGMLNSILNFCVEEVAEYSPTTDTINTILNAVQAIRITMIMETEIFFFNNMNRLIKFLMILSLKQFYFT